MILIRRDKAIRLALGLVISLAVSPLSADEAAPAGLHKGMTAAEVRQRLRTPGRIVRQVLYRRHIEQWVYENPLPMRVQFSCVRGEEPVMTAVLRGETTAIFRKD